MNNGKMIPKPPGKSNELLFPTLEYENNKVLFNKTFSVLQSNLPTALDLEEVVLGALMIDNKSITEVISILEPFMFYSFQNKLIYEAILVLYNSKKAIDILTVSNELKRTGKLIQIGGDFYLVNLTQRVASSAHIEFHARILVQKYVLRSLILFYIHMLKGSYEVEKDIFELLDSTTKKVNELYQNAIKINADAVSTDPKQELIDLVDKSRKGIAIGFPSGIFAFDDWCGGFRNRELITIGGRPGMGKTTFVLGMLRKSSLERNIPCLFFSLEMSESDVVQKLAAKGTEIPYSKIRNGKLNDQELHKVLAYYDYIKTTNLIIVDKMNHYDAIVNKIRETHIKNKLKIVVIDYVQLIKYSGNTKSDRRLEITDITRGLKALSIELDLPIIILAQISRGVDTRINKRPILGDLKESGSIEEDSDTVIFIYRDAYYKIKDNIPVPPHIVGETEFIVAKGRNIGTAMFNFNFDFEFVDYV